MSKTAKELFKELGYKERTTNYSLYAIKIYEAHGSIIYFDYDKHISKEGASIFINMNELKAILKQVEELGWLNDEV